MTGESVAGIILAAGLSSRMGRFKPLLPLGAGTIIEREVCLFREAGVSDIIVVAGHNSRALIPLLERLKVSFVLNPEYKRGMFSSVLAAIRAVNPAKKAFFMLPSDIPLVRRHTLARLMDSFGEGQIIYPTYNGKRGHPPLISCDFISGILSWSGEMGLRGFLTRQSEKAVDIPTADENILLDGDNPDDYEEILKRWDNHHLPTREECLILMKDIYNVEEHIICHSLGVADVALCLASALKEAGHIIDINLLERAALLHDISRKERRHAEAGGKLLRGLGFENIASVMEEHMDIKPSQGEPPGEKEILYLSDKMVRGDEVVSLKKRFGPKKEKFKNNEKALEALSRRENSAYLIKKQVEEITGRSVEILLKGTGK